MYRVELINGKVFEASAADTLLTAAAKAGVLLPYSCKTGRCSTCKCKVLSGGTSSLQLETGLSDSEKAEGWILACVRTAKSNLLMDVEDLGNFPMPPVKTQPCRISRLEALAPDVLKVVLRLPPSATFDYIPGQYVEVIGPDGVRRSYSFANAQNGDKTIELQVRLVSGGVMSDYWFNQAKVNDLLRLNGPLGTFVLRDIEGMDLFFLATGTGIAPVKAMVEFLADESIPKMRPRSITIIWGGRKQSDFYLNKEFAHGSRYLPVLSRFDETWEGRQGYVQDVILSLMPDLNQAIVYACGSDAMIHSARSDLLKAGLPRQRFYSDAFVCSAI